MTGAQQLAFTMPFRPALEREDFLIAPCNAEAVAAIDQWPHWTGPCLFLHGPAGSGKTHLLHVWQARSRAVLIPAAQLEALDLAWFQGDGPLAAAVEDLHMLYTRSGPHDTAEENLFHLFNSMKNRGGHLLVTAEGPANRLPVRLPDLELRLRGSPHIGIAGPDDELLGGLLMKLFRDRQLPVTPEILTYCLSRMERSFGEAVAVVDEIDALSLSQQRRITVPLVRGILDARDALRQDSLPF